ncbi:TonB-dependent receptor, partial [uncultured Chitinophaga sp.]
GYAGSDCGASACSAIALPGFPYPGNLVPEPQWGPLALESTLNQKLQRAFGTMRFTLTDRLKAVVGVNHAQYSRDGTSYGVASDLSRSKTSPYAGLTFEFTPSVLGYVSYSDLYFPQSQADANDRYLDPSKGTNYEAGLKADWLDKRLLTSVAVFQAKQSGLATPTGTYNQNGQAVYAPEDVKSTGVELEAVGRLNNHIDLTAGYTTLKLTGPDGGAASSFVAPGHEVVFSFKVINPGLYVYHCATAPVAMHIANGMYGLILVEPEGGLPPVDKEYYIMQGDFYTKGKNGQPGLQPFDMQKAVDEHPDYVVFNGKVGSLTGDNAIRANVGETVRLFVGNGGPNLVSSFHVIGEIFDNVHVEGGDLINKNVQTTLVPAGGAVIVDFKVEVPGTFVIVDHALTRTFNKGSLGMLTVTGDENKQIYSGKQTEGIYQPEGGTIQKMPGAAAPPAPKAANIEERIALGKSVYAKTCLACHQDNGAGIANAFPPLAKSDYLNEDAGRAIDVVLHGKQGEITVNGQKYNGVMPAQVLSDEEIANVLTYVYASWGNKKQEIKPAMVAAKRTH